MSKNQSIAIKLLTVGEYYKVNIEGIEYLVRLEEILNSCAAWCRCLNLSEGKILNLTLYHSLLSVPVTEIEKNRLVAVWADKAKASIEQYAQNFGKSKK